MAKQATDLTHKIMIALSPMGCILFKNTRGGAYPIQSVKPLIGAVLKKAWGLAAQLASSLRPIMAGLSADGSSDIIGGTRKIVTQDMVGKTVLIFTAIEVKVNDTVKPEQQRFIDNINAAGGLAGVARSPEDAKKIVSSLYD